MNWSIKIISKTLMTKISHISWGGYDKGFYGMQISIRVERIFFYRINSDKLNFFNNYCRNLLLALGFWFDFQQQNLKINKWHYYFTI